MPHRRFWICIAAIAGLAVTMFVMMDGVLQGTEVCTQCGAQREILRLYNLTLTSNVQPTTLSETFARHHHLVGHRHAWLFAAGRGLPPFGPMCAIGQGRHLWTNINNPLVTRFFDQLITWTDPPTVDHYRNLALDPKTAMRFSSAIQTCDFLEAGFPDRRSFESWWTSHRPELDSSLTQ